MRARDFFPLGIAQGSAFCNRKTETETLIQNLLNRKHTLLMASRRYGKSSLALHALMQSELPYVELDFYMATTEKVIEEYILKGVVDLIGKSLGSIEKLLNSIKKYVKTLKPKIDISASVFKLELTSEGESDPATNVKEGLLLLEKLLEEKNQYAVLFMDEFQSIGVIAQGKGIEGAIRHVAQKTKHLTFIFSGSNRKLLKTMFEDENRPLYKLCWKIPVTRITVEHYRSHVQTAANYGWGEQLEESVFDRIIYLTERHPFYMNKLCDRLFTYCNQIATMNDVHQAWQEILIEEKSDVVREISALPIGQKKVLQYIARGYLQLTSKESMLELEMTSSSIMTALQGLEEKDILEKENNQYLIINPVLKFYVAQRSEQDLRILL